MKEIVYNKLVRDKILEIIESSGKDFKYHIADEKEYENLLVKKLQEEVEEFTENPCVEEIADILEVIESLIDILGYSKEEVLEIKEKKKNDRGAFNKGIVLEKVIED
jgi:predicted house-cleaning noncanonical NTP pyrophosphatase (MazG superfamily)